jgi:hypothetical protein
LVTTALAGCREDTLEESDDGGATKTEYDAR